MRHYGKLLRATLAASLLLVVAGPGVAGPFDDAQGEVQGYDFNRMVVEFTMLDQDKVIQCAISTAAMDDLEGKRDVKPHQRVDQFMRLREVIEEQASRKFFEEKVGIGRPVILRSNDFAIVASLRQPHRSQTPT